MTQAFVDKETTGLDPDPGRHEIWEWAAIIRDHPDPNLNGPWCWQLPVDVARLDPVAADINGFHRRYTAPPAGMALLTACPPRYTAATHTHPGDYILQGALAAHIVGLLANRATWIGNVPNFDVRFAVPWLRARGQLPDWPDTPWHYRLVCVENLAAGMLCIPPPWDSDDLYARLGVSVAPADRHTALGDARAAELAYDAIMLRPDTAPAAVLKAAVQGGPGT